MLSGVWFEYEADEDNHFCEVDVLLVKGDPDAPEALVAVECKLSETEAGAQELHELYLPVLTAAYPDTPVSGALVFRYATTAGWLSGLTEKHIQGQAPNCVTRYKL